MWVCISYYASLRSVVHKMHELACKFLVNAARRRSLVLGTCALMSGGFESFKSHLFPNEQTILWILFWIPFWIPFCIPFGMPSWMPFWILCWISCCIPCWIPFCVPIWNPFWSPLWMYCKCIPVFITGIPAMGTGIPVMKTRFSLWSFFLDGFAPGFLCKFHANLGNSISNMGMLIIRKC